MRGSRSTRLFAATSHTSVPGTPDTVASVASHAASGEGCRVALESCARGTVATVCSTTDGASLAMPTVHTCSRLVTVSCAESSRHETSPPHITNASRASVGNGIIRDRPSVSAARTWRESPCSSATRVPSGDHASAWRNGDPLASRPSSTRPRAPLRSQVTRVPSSIRVRNTSRVGEGQTQHAAIRAVTRAVAVSTMDVSQLRPVTVSASPAPPQLTRSPGGMA